MIYLRYELQKLFSRKQYLISIVILLLLTFLFTFVYIHSSDIYQEKEKYLHLLNVDKEDASKQSMKLENEIQYYATLQKYETSVMMYENLNHDVFEEELSAIAKEYEDFIKTGNSLEKEIYIRKEIQTYIDTTLNYPNYINTIMHANTTNHMTQSYDSMKNTELDIVNYLGIELYGEQYFSCIVILIFSILTTFYVFEYEEESKMREILILTKNGQKRTYLIKFLVCIGVVMIFCILLSMVVFLIFGAMFGLPNIYSHIQSIPMFYEAPYHFTIMQWLLIDIVMQFILCIAFVNIFIVSYTFIRNTKLSILPLFILLVISYGLYSLINPYATISIVRYINMYYWIQTSQLMASYMGHTLYGVTFSNVPSLVTLLVITSLGGLFSILHLSVTLNKARKLPIKLNFSIGKNVSHLGHELHKALIMNKGWVVLMLLIMYMGYRQYHLQKAITTVDYELIEVYNNYGGQLDDTKITKIENQKQVYDEKENTFINIQAKYNIGEIDEHTYTMEFEVYNDSLQEKMVFNRFYNEYVNRQGNYIIYNNGYQAIFSVNSNQRDIIYSTLLTFAMILIVSTSFTIDQKDNEDMLYALTLHGNHKRTQYKQFVMLIIGICAYIVVFGTDFFGFHNCYPMSDWNAPISSILRTGDSLTSLPFITSDTPLIFYFLILQITRLLGIVLLGYIVMLLSKKSKHTLIVVTTSLGAIFIPWILTISGIHIMKYFSVFDIISGNLFLQSEKDAIRSIVSIVFLVFCIMVLNKKDCNKRFDFKIWFSKNNDR